MLGTSEMFGELPRCKNSRIRLRHFTEFHQFGSVACLFLATVVGLLSLLLYMATNRAIYICLSSFTPSARVCAHMRSDAVMCERAPIRKLIPYALRCGHVRCRCLYVTNKTKLFEVSKHTRRCNQRQGPAFWVCGGGGGLGGRCCWFGIRSKVNCWP